MGEQIRATYSGKPYAESPGRYKAQGDIYLVVKHMFTPKEAARAYAQDHPHFKGTAVVIGTASTKPAIGINRRIIKEYLFDIANGQETRRKKK